MQCMMFVLCLGNIVDVLLLAIIGIVSVEEAEEDEEKEEEGEAKNMYKCMQSTNLMYMWEYTTYIRLREVC